MINTAQKVVKFTVAKRNSGDQIMFGNRKFNKKRVQEFGGETRRKKTS